MTIEKNIFQKQRPNYSKLLSFGFHKENGHYLWRQQFFADQFLAQLDIDQTGKVTGQLIDLNSGDEYLPLRASHLGPYASQVKTAYEQLLETIAHDCFIAMPFHSSQANRLASAIKQQFNDDPEFVFKRMPDDAIFREPVSQKWYGLVMHIPITRLDQHVSVTDKKVDILEFRIDPHKRPSFLQQASIYPAYHMNKDNWLCVILDDTQPDQQIMKLVTQSRQFLCRPHAWLIPDNPRYYDIMHAFKDPNDLLLLKQSTKVRVNDPVFIYVTNPAKAVIFQCRAIQVNIPYHYHSKQVRLNQAMKLQLVKRYPANKYDLNFLKAHGIRYIHGPRKVSDQLAALFY